MKIYQEKIITEEQEETLFLYVVRKTEQEPERVEIPQTINREMLRATNEPWRFFYEEDKREQEQEKPLPVGKGIYGAVQYDHRAIMWKAGYPEEVKDRHKIFYGGRSAGKSKHMSDLAKSASKDEYNHEEADTVSIKLHTWDLLLNKEEFESLGKFIEKGNNAANVLYSAQIDTSEMIKQLKEAMALVADFREPLTPPTYGMRFDIPEDVNTGTYKVDIPEDEPKIWMCECATVNHKESTQCRGCNADQPKWEKPQAPTIKVGDRVKIAVIPTGEMLNNSGLFSNITERQVLCTTNIDKEFTIKKKSNENFILDGLSFLLPSACLEKITDQPTIKVGQVWKHNDIGLLFKVAGIEDNGEPVQTDKDGNLVKSFFKESFLECYHLITE